VIQPPEDNLYQVVLPLTDVPLFCATTLTVALALNPRTTLALVCALLRTFNAAVVLTLFEIADSDDEAVDAFAVDEDEADVL